MSSASAVWRLAMDMDVEGGLPEPAEPLLGRYSNYFEVGHNQFEFLLDFGQFYPGNDRPQLHTRIVMSPTYAKALLRTLGESLLRYERTFGSVEDQT